MTPIVPSNSIDTSDDTFDDDTPCPGNERISGERTGFEASALTSALMPESAGQYVDDDADQDIDGPCPGNEAPRGPAIAETAWDDDSTEPGDDIGNRIDGPAHHERTTTAAESDAAAKLQSKRSKKSDPPSNESEGAARTRGKRGAPTRDRPAFGIGEQVFGKVVEMTPDAIFVDLSGKAKAIFDRHELTDDSRQIGDHFVAIVHGDGTRGGLVVLTNNADRVEAARIAVCAAFESEKNVDALVTGVVKGGVELDIDGLRAFAPGSHVDLRLGADLTRLIGTRLAFKVVKCAKNGREVVLSRRDILEQQASLSRQDGLAKLLPGTVVDAVVRSIVEWGVFVAIPSANGVEGLIHLSEASFDRNPKLPELFKVGQSIQVKVLRIDEKGKLWLSRKAAAGDPWDAIAVQFAVGVRASGRIVRMQPFGVFVELAPGVDGLIRTADLSARRINDPSEVVSIGDVVDVVVAHVDAKQHRIGLHPALKDGVEEPRQRVAVGKILQVEVASAESAGLMVRILGVTGASARGFIPAGHTNTARGTDLRREFAPGTKLDAKVIDVDAKRGEVKLSIRALKKDTEDADYHEYKKKVARESKFGTMADLFAKRRAD